MLAKKTVLILGAGASWEYGLPTGKELLDSIYDLCVNPQTETNFDHLLDVCKITRTQATELADLIQNGPALSIDLLLQYRTKFIEVGKAAIAYALMPKENPSNLTDLKERADRWYPYLFEQLRTPRFELFEKNPLTVVTYNYDRSLDAYLRFGLANYYDPGDAKIEEAMASIPIIHLHGQLGDLKDNPYRQYKHDERNVIEALKRAKDGIKIIHEIDERVIDPEFASARHAIITAEEIIFLGFGFNPENLKRLKVKKKEGASVYASAYGMTNAETQHVSLSIAQGPMRFGGWGNPRILAFLREAGCLQRAAD